MQGTAPTNSEITRTGRISPRGFSFVQSCCVCRARSHIFLIKCASFRHRSFPFVTTRRFFFRPSELISQLWIWGLFIALGSAECCVSCCCGNWDSQSKRLLKGFFRSDLLNSSTSFHLQSSVFGCASKLPAKHVPCTPLGTPVPCSALRSLTWPWFVLSAVRQMCGEPRAR